MPQLELWHVNVFSGSPFGGNPAAVGFCDGALDAGIMQSIARVMNLSESVFISSPQDSRADYKARIFTGRRELPFAGHPTIAAAFAFIQKHRRLSPDESIRVRQECGLGIVDVESMPRAHGRSLFVAQREASHTQVDLEQGEIARALGCPDAAVRGGPISAVSTGVPWLIAELDTLDAVRTLVPDFSRIARLSKATGTVGMTVFSRQTADPKCHAHLRSFAPAEGIYEDPVCGSCHGALAAHLMERCPEIAQALDNGEALKLEQGEEIGLPGCSEVMARKSGGRTRLLVGGESVVTLKGVMQW